MRAHPDTSRRSFLERVLVGNWEFGHLRVWAGARLAVGTVEAMLAVLVLAYGVYWLAGLLLVVAVLTLAVGYWEMTLARR